MTIDQCIELAERECCLPPCETLGECDLADCCLADLGFLDDEQGFHGGYAEDPLGGSW